MTDNPKPVVTLLAERGKKYDETRQCISSYEGSIVFLPRDVSSGQIVRVELTPVEKKDARGSVMYQAGHAWFDLGRDERHAIVREAEVLRSCEVFAQAEALALLAARFGAVPHAWKEYSHYYFQSAGAIYASKYAPAMLTLFEAFTNASWKGLIEPLLWIGAGVKPVADDLFSLRQEGKEIDWRFSVPQLTDEEVGKIVGRIEKAELLLSAPLIEVDSSGRLRASGWDENEWQKASFPQTTVPDFAVDSSAEIPVVVEFVYGLDINGSELTAYGVIGAVTSSWSQTRFQFVWKKDRQEADAERERSVAELLKFREKLEADRIAATEQAERERIAAEEEARRVAEAEAARLAAEAEERRQAEESVRHEVELTAAEARGEILRNFEAFVHTSSQRGDGGGYVIRPDGSLRECDNHQYERSHQRGRHDMVWEVVQSDEVALEWRGFRDQVEGEQAEVRKPPVGGFTPEQLAAMRRLAQQHGARGWRGSPDYPQPDARKPRREPSQTPPKKPEYWATSERSKRADEADAIDPDSPFAKLATLRKQMSGK